MSELIINVVSPHSDDAALSLSQSLSTLIDQGASVRVISCFTTSTWAPRLEASASIDVVTSVRYQEDLAFVQRLGPQATLHHLGMVDEPLRPPCAPLSHSAHGPDSPVVQALVEALRQAQIPRGIWMVPMAVRHPDHLIALWAGLAAAAGEPVVIYEDMPYALAFTPDEIARQTQHFSQLVRQPLQPATLGQFKARHWCDLVGCYASQFSAPQVAQWAAQIESRGGERLWLSARAAERLAPQLKSLA
ncbi:2'-N-acetylparomamine deacetylase [Pseudomonas sp. 37 R 15]|uniref:PIG-L family deacetylase n=1 Tax=Pseudomonas sp. 37 R 15 TaxID=1844104 RepID=UPI0008125CDF|nr:PIG-L family deacetylase [Pseudomonas sp. 37 R 15]CRM79633.1 2'-N-acetylparomamine deacetylase [Pseudomonas sp. 37 R 15]